LSDGERRINSGSQKQLKSETMSDVQNVLGAWGIMVCRRGDCRAYEGGPGGASAAHRNGGPGIPDTPPPASSQSRPYVGNSMPSLLRQQARQAAKAAAAALPPPAMSQAQSQELLQSCQSPTRALVPVVGAMGGSRSAFAEPECSLNRFPGSAAVL
jgi:hypothetical protein